MYSDVKSNEDVISVPAFDGNSYLEIPITSNVKADITYEVWFLARQEYGLYSLIVV